MPVRLSRSIEVRMPVSPTKGFYRQVALFAASALAIGYTLDGLVIKVFAGAATEADIDPIWSRPIPLCKVIWSDRERVARESYFAECDDAFTHPNFDAPVVVYCDADTVWLRRLNELVVSLTDIRNSIAGVTAHNPPPGRFRLEPQKSWDEVALPILGHPAPLDYRCSVDREVHIPFYVNFGFVASSAAVVSEFGSNFISISRAVVHAIPDHPYF